MGDMLEVLFEANPPYPTHPLVGGIPRRWLSDKPGLANLQSVVNLLIE